MNQAIKILALLTCLPGLILAKPTEVSNVPLKQPYTIQLNFIENESIQTETEEHLDLEMNMDMEFQADGQKKRHTQTIALEATATQTFTDETLESSKGRSVKVRRTYQDVNVESKTTPPSLKHPIAEETLLKGTSILLSRTEQGAPLAKQEGGTEPKLKSLIKNLESLNDMYAPFLPTQPVRLLDTWEPDRTYLKRLPQKLKKLVGGILQEEGEIKLTDASVGATCTFLKIRETTEGLIGTIEVVSTVKASYKSKTQSGLEQNDESGKAQATMTGQIHLTVKAKTLLEINLATSRLVADASTGSIEFTMNAEVERSEEPMHITLTAEASGPLTGTTTFTYLKK